MEQKFIEYVRNVDNWEIEGSGFNNEKIIVAASEKSLNQECCGENDFK